MFRPLYLLPAAALATACSGFGSAHSHRAPSPPEFRTAAASIMGKDVGNTLQENPRNPNPRIRLDPSPGKARMIGDPPGEVLESDPKSGAYIAFTGQVPPTKYFEVRGSADCDDWLYLPDVTLWKARKTPGYYFGPQYVGNKPRMVCEQMFHQRYRDKSDERLADSDGVIFDPDTAVITDQEGLINGYKKVRMSGWAIRFVEPTTEQIERRLARPPGSTIDTLQLKAAAYWIEAHQASQFAPALRRLLPLESKDSALHGWQGATPAVLKALAAVEPAEAPVDVYVTILEAGMARMFQASPRYTVSGLTVGEAPYVAANVLACRQQPGTVEVFERVLMNATIFQHKMAAVAGLLAMGQRDRVVRHLEAGELGDVTNRVSAMLWSQLPADRLYQFACPYRSIPDARA